MTEERHGIAGTVVAIVGAALLLAAIGVVVAALRAPDLGQMWISTNYGPTPAPGPFASGARLWTVGGLVEPTRWQRFVRRAHEVVEWVRRGGQPAPPKSGYVFQWSAVTIAAPPVTPSGRRFYVDESGVIRFTTGSAPAPEEGE